ncbi:MATE family efflux transporter [Methylobrevis albus]|uniref:Multidrug resistance protein NorM n=1 Tax=Methylobrevis albus TaxID=2793297 RepID=A0A931MYH0_9HYPH|nr:MATE family efflux transporter [Methylobrevis albus]MBH0237985.1 hypothetical protein [Methylobrevis albus]
MRRVHFSRGPGRADAEDLGALAGDGGHIRPSTGIGRHVIETLHLAGPIGMGHLSYLATSTATLILFGALSPDALAAGGLALRVAVSTNILSGILLCVGVFISEAQGARHQSGVAGLYWNGLYLSLALSLVSFTWMSMAHHLLAAVGQPPEIVAQTQACLDVMRWAEPANLIRLGLMRAVLPALGKAAILYALTPLTLGLYVVTAMMLVDGVGIIPAQGWLGVPMAMAATNWIGALAMLAAVHGTATRKLIPFARLHLDRIGPILRIGYPIGVMQAIDGMFFLAITLLIGTFGAPALAAHQIALNCGTIAYATAASCGDAGALRISYRRGARAYADARTAGLVAVALGVAFMTVAAAAVFFFPDVFIGFFVDVDAPANAATVLVARDFVVFASLFVFVDGFYGTGMAVLRGLGDNRFAMLVVAVAYWCVGLPVGLGLAYLTDMGPSGIWCGLVAGLGAVGVTLVWRYDRLSRRMRDAAAPAPFAGLSPGLTDIAP